MGGILTARQMKYIYALAREGGLDGEALHGIVYATARREHIGELTVTEAKRVIDRLKVLTGQPPARKVPDRATREQAALIYALAGELGWSDDPRRLTAFLEKRYGVSLPNFLTRQSTNNCIAALKAMVAGGRGERKGGADG